MKTLLMATIAALALPAAAQESAALIERREAAAGFVLPQAMMLGALRRECRALMPPDDGPDRVAEAWWERNRASLDAGQWIVGQAIARQRAEAGPAQAQAREMAILHTLSGAMLNMLRTSFAREMPSERNCAQALQRFRRPELDLHTAAAPGMPMPAQWQEFARTLAEVPNDARYRPPEDRVRRFEAQVVVTSIPVIAYDAIEAARERSDTAAEKRGYERLAADGDAMAAQSLGVMYLTGRGVPKSLDHATAWFYNAWLLGDAEGLNALGVVWRDGLTAAAEPAYALAAFAAAMKTPQASPAARQRAATNLQRLMPQAPAPAVAEAACLRWAQLHAHARALASNGAQVALRPQAALPAEAAQRMVMEGQLSAASQPACPA